MDYAESKCSHVTSLINDGVSVSSEPPRYLLHPPRGAQDPPARRGQPRRAHARRADRRVHPQPARARRPTRAWGSSRSTPPTRPTSRPRASTTPPPSRRTRWPWSPRCSTRTESRGRVRASGASEKARGRATAPRCAILGSQGRRRAAREPCGAADRPGTPPHPEEAHARRPRERQARRPTARLRHHDVRRHVAGRAARVLVAAEPAPRDAARGPARPRAAAPHRAARGRGCERRGGRRRGHTPGDRRLPRGRAARRGRTRRDRPASDRSAAPPPTRRRGGRAAPHPRHAADAHRPALARRDPAGRPAQHRAGHALPRAGPRERAGARGAGGDPLHHRRRRGGRPQRPGQSNDTRNPALGPCIATALRRWQFPQADDQGEVQVSYPFVLTAAQYGPPSAMQTTVVSGGGGGGFRM